MESKKLHKAKQHNFEQPRLLTRSEIESLRRDMKESSIWMKSEIKRRRAAKSTNLSVDESRLKS